MPGLYCIAMIQSPSRLSLIVRELRLHLPFTLSGVAGALLVLLAAHFWIIPFIHADRQRFIHDSFHAWHALHVFLSAIATTAIFYRHQKNIPGAIFIGYFSTLALCGLSDWLLPYLGGRVMGIDMHLHMCLIEEPGLVLTANTIGILIGLFTEAKFGKISYFSHGFHVLVSSLASLFYLVSFGVVDWISFSAGIFIVTTISVIIPCCSSDIIIPLSFVSGIHGHEHEDEHTCHHHS